MLLPQLISRLRQLSTDILPSYLCAAEQQVDQLRSLVSTLELELEYLEETLDIA